MNELVQILKNTRQHLMTGEAAHEKRESVSR